MNSIINMPGYLPVKLSAKIVQFKYIKIYLYQDLRKNNVRVSTLIHIYFYKRKNPTIRSIF